MSQRRNTKVVVGSKRPLKEGGLSADVEVFLLKLRYKLGQLLTVGGHQPIPLDDEQSAWVVYAGRLDLFALPLENGRVSGTRYHLLRVEAGQIVMGLGGGEAAQMALIAIGGPGTQLIKLTRAQLAKLVADTESSDYVITMLEGWVRGLAEATAVDLPPQESQPIQPGEVVLAAHQSAHARRGVVWIEPLDGQFCWWGNPALAVADGLTPLAGSLWVRATEAGRLRAVSTADFCTGDPAWTGVDRFHAGVRAVVALRMTGAAQATVQQLRDMAEQSQMQMFHALSHLANVLEPEAHPFIGDDVNGADQGLLSACQWVGQALGVTIQSPPPHLPHLPLATDTPPTATDPLGDIARASRLRMRQIALPEGWWRTANEALLAYRQDGSPVALLPRRGKWFASTDGYELADPRTGIRSLVTAEVAASLAPIAHVFYRPLPARALTIRDLFRLGFHDARREWVTVAFTGVALGLLGLAVPLMIGVLFNSIIPSAARAQLWQLGAVLFACIVSSGLFLLTQNVTVLRLEGKWDSAVLPAIWDRLLRLPPAFFRQGTAGDMAERAMGLDRIRRTLSSSATSAMLATPTALFSLGLLFYYDMGLAVIAVSLAFLLGGVTAVAWRLGVGYQRQLAEQEGAIAGMALEFATGIAKLRVAGAESRAFARWTQAFGAQRVLAFKSRNTANVLTVFNAAFLPLTTLAIFALIAWPSAAEPRLSTGDFLAFYAAFGQFLFIALTLSGTLLSLLPVTPLYERARPILQTLPEVAPLQADPGVLRGEIELNHVVFRYREDEPPVLKEISLQVRPGEFVALVGASGCGKSTLIRLLLGFERPLSGAIYYDGQDLSGLDVERVRRQIGVVLQNSQLLTGTLLSNIIGSLPLSVDEAWEAARLVGLSDDIADLPMGMHTLVSDGSSTLSGGQRQRLLIARAIVSKPRLLFFDEATSALDNRSQALVSASLEQLQATRIVVAHRLSTIVHADRIVVLDNGRVAQSGSYAELSKKRGLFADLIRRQVL